MITVLIADDHALVGRPAAHPEERQRLRGGRRSVDSASTIALVRDRDADVLVLDLSMPGRNGVELIKQIKDESRAAYLVLTMHAEQQYAVRAFRAGAAGYHDEGKRERRTGRGADQDRGRRRLREPDDGRAVRAEPERADRSLPHQRLSDREFDVFRRVTTGELTEIAHALNVSVKTVSTYKMRILEKMQMANDGARPLRDAHKLFDDPDEL
jgi:DNA-binding NarL/FixJ family response regulator